MDEDNGLDTGFRGRELWREGLSSKFKEDKVSKTPRTVEGRGLLRRHKGSGYTSAVGEYTPEEFWDALDYIDELERELSAAQERIAQLTAPGEYDEDVKCDDKFAYRLQYIANVIEQLQATVRELEAERDSWRASRSGWKDRATQAEARLAEYNELLYAVGNKYPNESRHETALRYIREREQMSIHISQTAEGIHMIPEELHVLAEEVASSIFDRKEGAREAAYRALAKLQEQHEAERTAAVAEALERAAQEADHWQLYGNKTHRCGAYIAAAIRSLKPRSDMVCVPAAEWKPEGAFIAKDGKTPIEISVSEEGVEAERYKP